MPDRARDPHVPAASLIFGYGPMLPLVASALATWLVGGWLAFTAIRLAIIWAALILCFVGGVRRGFGFGDERAATPVEVATCIAYFTLAGLSLIVPGASAALSLLVAGYVLVALLDRRAALIGDAPAHFARLRPTQMLVGAAALAALWAWLLV